MHLACGRTRAALTARPCPAQERLLRIAPFAQQVEYFRGDPARLVQRWAGAALVTIVASTKAALLAAGAVTFPLWWPWVQAANKNRALLAQHRCMDAVPPRVPASLCGTEDNRHAFVRLEWGAWQRARGNHTRLSMQVHGAVAGKGTEGGGAGPPNAALQRAQ